MFPMRHHFLILTALIFIIYTILAFTTPSALWTLILVGPVILLGFIDIFQKKQTIRKNFPLVGHFRYLLEKVRPEIQQYFIESDIDGKPINRERRSLVYQRAKGVLDTIPFGTKRDVYASGYEWVNHSMLPIHFAGKDLRVEIGNDQCAQPYKASLLNISAMSFGALSRTAVLSLSQGANKGGFAMNTGEGSLSRYHREGGGDLIWQLGTGYFGCCKEAGIFSPEKFEEISQDPQIKMIEIKISQGAKPGHGGILPAHKVTQEIAEIRGVPMGKDVISPPSHSAFSTPTGLLDFVQQLRTLSGGKPVGFKLCLGKRRHFMSICKAMVEKNIYPDFITVDGGEGGTGAAPLEFSNSIGCPLKEALCFIHNCLVGFSIKDKIKIIAASGVITGFDIISRIAIGADLCYSARGMMLALGCIQALRCNSNDCPTGIATQDPRLYKGININSKAERVYQFHHETLHSAGEIMGAMGLESPGMLRPWHLMRRIDFTTIKHYGEIFQYLSDGDLLKQPLPIGYERALNAALASSFE